MADYAHPEVLVSTDWLRENLKTPTVRVVEIDVDPKLYAAGHIPNAVGWDWTTQLNDEGAPLTTDVPKFPKSQYKVSSVDGSLRARVPEVFAASEKKAPLVDVRSPDEFTGKIIAPPGMSETAQRGGHVPGATSIPWSTAVTNENTFKSADELRAIYLDQKRLDPAKATIAYCRIGERSSHTWFVLKYLLGFKDVKNYDGSWTEYGNIVGAP